ncbi:FUSC family protein [Reyranella sp.]|uniref:FUSC family protein n=1 Tax=Reyranella sp. TaxID=1929291 RepID=UPI003BAC2FCD
MSDRQVEALQPPRGLLPPRGARVAPGPPLPAVVTDGLAGLLFSLKTFAAAILALLTSYWLEVNEPQWSVITAYLVSQPLVGALWSKGAYRIAGTVVGAAFAIFCVGLLAQAGPLFILVMALWIGACAFGATLTRNYASYGFALAGFSAPMIAFESMAAPALGWSLAADRATEVILGIVCAGLVHALILPRYARDALGASLDDTFAGLARYAAIVLRPGTPDADFTRMRQRMAADVLKFDALRSYAVFESATLRREDGSLARVIGAFLGLMSVARGLHVRLEFLRQDEDPAIARLLDPALRDVADQLEEIAADREGPLAPAVGARLQDMRRRLDEMRRQLEAMAATEDAEVLANGLLVLHRTDDMVEALSRVVAAATGSDPSGSASAGEPVWLVFSGLRPDPRAALVQAVRAASALLVVGAYWLASAWTAGVSAMTGLAIVIVMFISAPNQVKQATDYVVGVVLAMIVAFFARAFLLPQLGDFVALAALLGIVMIPVGMFMTNATWGMIATAFAAFYASQLGLSNLPSFDTATYVDGSLGLLLGLAAGVLAIELILPYDHGAMRRREWREVLTALPGAARGERPERGARTPILLALLRLMPRLDLRRPADDEVMNGSFGAASMSLELARLRARLASPDLPDAARSALAACLEHLAAGFERLRRTEMPAARGAVVDDCLAAVDATRATLRDASATIDVLHALASLRFLADRLAIDRAFLTFRLPGVRA